MNLYINTSQLYELIRGKKQSDAILNYCHARVCTGLLDDLDNWCTYNKHKNSELRHMLMPFDIHSLSLFSYIPTYITIDVCGNIIYSNWMSLSTSDFHFKTRFRGHGTHTTMKCSVCDLCLFPPTRKPPAACKHILQALPPWWLTLAGSVSC